MGKLVVMVETATSDSAKIKALELCGRELGMFQDQHSNVVWDGDLRKLSTPQLKKAIEALDAMSEVVRQSAIEAGEMPEEEADAITVQFGAAK